VTNRVMALPAMAVMGAAVAAAMLVGPASAHADDGASSTGTKAPQSQHRSSAPSNPTGKPAKAPAKTRHDSAGSGAGDRHAPSTPKSQTPQSVPAADITGPGTPRTKTVTVSATQPRSATAPEPTVGAEDAALSLTTTARAATAVKAERSAQVTSSTLATTPTRTPTPTPTKPTLLNLVGSLLFNVLGAALQAFTGPPQLPAGSTVTVRTSSLTLPDTGQTVVADWYFPNDGDTPTRLIYLQHGFLANAAMYSYTAAYLSQQTDSIVVAPSLSSDFLDPSGDWLGGTPEQQAVADLFVGNRDALTESASVAAGHAVTLPTRFVLMGHSLGGALVTAAAGDTVANGAINDLAGVVLLDSVDLNNAVPTALQKLTGTDDIPVEDISSVPYVWNVDGIVGQELQAARPGQFDGVMLVNGHHIDAAQGGNPLIQLAEYLAAGPSEPQNIDAVKLIAAGWVNDLFAGTHTGIYGAPQQSIQIPTAAGTATAVVLPFISTTPVQVTPFDGIAQLILNVALSQAVYTPLT
jgi:pimeloyl-ACP methyl ester carboxylesterase